MTEPAPDELPPWLRQLARAARSVEAAELTRFLPADDGTGRESAVLITFSEPAAGPSVLLIQRSADMRNHAGQVAFPGGAVDPADPDHVSAALREAEEEVGLDPGSVRVVAELPAIPLARSNFLVTPVLAWWPEPYPVAAVDPAEVAHVVNVPIADLVEPANRFRVRHPSGIAGPGFEAAGLFVWGFTAILLDRLLELGGWTQPWDTDDIRPLPSAVLGRPVAPAVPPPASAPEVVPAPAEDERG